MRPSCLECTGKHLAQACELIKETKTGYPSFHWYVIGHLAEAEEETVRDYPDLANEIREYRVAWTEDHKVVIPFEELFERIDAMMESTPYRDADEADDYRKADGRPLIVGGNAETGKLD